MASKLNGLWNILKQIYSLVKDIIFFLHDGLLLDECLELLVQVVRAEELLELQLQDYDCAVLRLFVEAVDNEEFILKLQNQIILIIVCKAVCIDFILFIHLDKIIEVLFCEQRVILFDAESSERVQMVSHTRCVEGANVFVIGRLQHDWVYDIVSVTEAGQDVVVVIHKIGSCLCIL